MVAPVKPVPVRAQAKDKWQFALAVANLAAPTVAEVTAVTGFDLSCSLLSDYEGVTATAGRVTLPQLLCETESYEAIDTTTYSLAALRVVWRPQDAAASNGKKAWEALTDGGSGFLIRRQGLVNTADFAAGQFVDVFPVEFGRKIPTKTSTGADSIYAFDLEVSIVSQPSFNKAIAA